jgi:hypothetical protein
MGTWGPGLYSDDFALDLKASISAVCRLPHDADEIVRILAELNPAANQPDDDDHTTFWLVVADQLQRKGLESAARERARRIIADGTNIAVLEQLGMSRRDLRQRAKALAKAADRLAAPPEPKQRRTLKKPQPLIVLPGEVYVFPVDSRANVYNPYFTNPDEARFAPAGWSSCLIVGAGHALEFLAWYQVAPSLDQWAERPSLKEVIGSIDPGENSVGTVSKSHFTRMQLERAGTVEPPNVDPPEHDLVMSAVASDISASNALSRWLPEGSVPPKRRWFGFGKR